MADTPCELCRQVGGLPVWQGDLLRVIRVPDVDHPAFYRVIWQAHVAEWTDLPPEHRSLLMRSVAQVETALRAAVQPDKVNLASLGNMVAHLHWHVIARYRWDAHWPQPVWGMRQREVSPAAETRLPMSLSELDARVVAALGCRD